MAGMFSLLGQARKTRGAFWLYIILLNAAVFLASVSLHEFGHLAVGSLLGCKAGELVLLGIWGPDAGGTYTLMDCPQGTGENSIFLGLSGFVFLVPLGLAFILLKKFPERNLSIVILGLGLLLAGLDFLLIIPSSILTYISLAAGTGLVCLGEIFLASDYTSCKSQRERTETIVKTL
jgi:hypothetical protein